MADYFNIPQDMQVVNYDPEEEQNQAAAQQQEQRQLLEGREQEQAELEQRQAELDALDEPEPSIPERVVQHVGGNIKGALTRSGAMAAGTLDTVFNAVGLVPWLKPVDEWWDKTKPKYQDPLNKAIYNASSVIIPSLLGGGAVVGGLGKVTQAMNISKRARVIGSIAADLGVDTAVAATASITDEDDNIARALNDWLGFDIPWATRDGDSPDVRRAKNILENLGLGAGLGVLQGFFALKGGMKLVPTDPKAAKALKESEDAATAARAIDPEADDVADAIQQSADARTAAQTDEGVRQLEMFQDTDTYNPWFNEPHEPQARAIPNVEANPLGAKADHARIQNNAGTTYGRARAAVTDSFQKKFMQAADGTERNDFLQELFAGFAPSVDAVIGKTKLTAKQLDSAVDNLTSAVFKTDLNDFIKTVNSMKKTVYEGQKFLGEEEWVIASQAFKRAFEEVYDPNSMRASAMMTQQSADTVADTSRGVLLTGDSMDTTRQQEIILEKLELLAQEVRANQYIAGRTLEYKKLVKAGNNEKVAEWMAKQSEDFTENLQKAKEKGTTVVQTLKDIAKENPSYLQPFIKAYDATNGDVDTLFKLHRWTEEHIGVIKKGLFDRNPEIPSYIIQGLRGIRYNSVLSGLAPLRALTGAMIATAAKPVSVLAGAAAQGDVAQIKRAFYTFGGITENFQRGIKMMGEEWRLAVSAPEEAALRGRGDLFQAKMNDLEVMESMAEGWRKEGKMGKVGLWNLAKSMSWLNNNKYFRYGINGMYAIDGLTKSFMASGVARAKAYDEIFEQTGGVVDKTFDKLFKAKQQELYDKAFDKTGLLTDEAAKHAAGEIALNLDNKLVSELERVMQRVPFAQTLFMFPRTGANALEFGWSFNPLSSIGPAFTKARNVLDAKTTEEITAALAEHGLEYSMEAFQALKSEYIGRQIMGGTVVMTAGMWALNGNLTGNGPQAGEEKRRMISMGWQPLSIKNPVTGEWHSYQGLEPFDTLLGLVGDWAYQSSRVDQAWSEEIGRKIAYSISMNIANKTFLSGFEPLISMLSGDESAWSRFMASNLDSLAPFSGARGLLSKAITPQLKDVENDFLSYIANRNKFLPSVGDGLEDMLDVYTGEPIKYFEPFTAAMNAFMPFFKSNGGMEPWRQWLLSTGWDNLETVRTNPNSKEPLTPKERQWVNNWIAQNIDLKGSIEQMMNHPDKYWDKLIKLEVKQRGQLKQSERPIKKLIVHRELDRLHTEAFNQAWAAWEQSNSIGAHIGALKDLRNRQLEAGAQFEASSTVKQIQDLLQMQNK